MATSVADFKARFPEFAATDDARVGLFLNDAADDMGEEAVWNGFFDRAQAYLAAHKLAVGMNTEAGNPLTFAPLKENTVGDRTKVFAIADVDPMVDPRLSTSYGHEYLRLRKKAGSFCMPQGF